MKLYVGTYAKYNSGSLKGEWVDLNDFSSKEDFLEYCKELHNDEYDPELMFQDYEDEEEGEYEAFASESSIDDEYWEYKDVCEEEGIPECVALCWLSMSSNRSISDIADHKAGSYEDFETYFTSELGNEIPDYLQGYIDWKGLEENYNNDCDTIEYDGTTYLFSC